MSRRPFKAQSADGPMMFPALEMYWPEGQRITQDPAAIDMLSPGVRATVRMLRWPWLRGVLARSLDRQMPGLWGGMVARKRYADDRVAEALAAGIDQFVILGAGFDTRAFRQIAPTGAEAFEVDMPGNIAMKESLLRRRSGRIPDHVHLVGVDFEPGGGRRPVSGGGRGPVPGGGGRSVSGGGLGHESDDLAGSLDAAGFRQDRPAMYVLEAVTQYLTGEAISDLFTYLSRAAAGSELLFTYVDQNFLDGAALHGWDKAYRKWVVKDRVWTFGLDPAEVAGFLEPGGWALLEQVGAKEYHDRYFAPANRDLTVIPIERFVHASKAS